MAQIIKVLGTLFAGMGIGTIIPSSDLSAPAGTSAQNVANWPSIIAIGGVVMGILVYALFGKKLGKIFK